MKSKKLSVREMCQIGVFVAIIAACAQVVVPGPGGVPFTLQVWAISLAGLMLGARKGTIAAVAYVLLGAFGAPVFAGMAGGLGVIMRHTGGFIISFPIVAWLAGIGGQRGGIVWALVGLAAGSVVNLAIGLVWFSWIMGLSLAVSFGYAVAPFLIVTVVRTVVLPFISGGLKAAFKRAGVEI